MTTVLTDEQREMVLTHVPLVEHIVNRVSAGLPSRYARDDLVQTGILGLITATVRFDPDRGVSFSTFAGRRIEGAIIDHLRRSDWAPRSVRALERRLVQAQDRNPATDPSVALDQASRELGIDRGQLERLRQDIVKARVDSLDRPVGIDGDGPTPLSDTVVDPSQGVEDRINGFELVGYLRDGVALLPERHRIVIIGYFFDGRTMTDLGALLGVTQSRASQIKDEALTMLRQALDQIYQESGDEAGPPGRRPSARQVDFNRSLAGSRPWQDRLAAGKGISIIG